MDFVSNELYEYAVSVRRQLHQYPEIGFELDKTVKLVSEELDKIGIPYTYEYGKGSVVAHLGQGDKMIALRADMDALPVEEKTDVPYKSKISGQMHACGHDSHTAVLLAVAKYLKENENKLTCRVRLIFQPSEEGAVSGAKMMVENGVCDGVDHIICTHCDNAINTGKIGICYGDYMAACIPATIRFKGRTSHAALPEYGIDAVAMAVEAYNKMKAMVKEEAGELKYIWSVGHFQGGHVHNVIADLCQMDISFRFYNMDFSKRVERNVRNICSEIANRYGGSVEIIWNMSTGPVHNDETITEKFKKTARNAGLNMQDMPQRMSSEDFGWYLEKVPGMIFRFGTRNEETGCTALAHRNDFCIDEEGMKIAIQAFCAYVMQCRNFG
ncbi:MAG: amidohydrolase [Clostridia bacterium]|nr:amidohydrolase [Clostridia bacterium]